MNTSELSNPFIISCIVNIILLFIVVSPNLIYIFHKSWFSWRGPDAPVTEEWLLSVGAVKNSSLIMDGYTIDMSKHVRQFRVLSMSIEPGNTYLYIREGQREEVRHKDDVCLLHNADYNGPLMQNKVRSFYYEITGKTLKAK